MKRLPSSVAATSLALLLLMPAQSQAARSRDVSVQWIQDQYDASHTGYNPHETILSPSTVGGLGVKWSGSAYLNQTASPIVTTTTVYMAGGQAGLTAASQLRAYDKTTGQFLWRVVQPQGDTVAGIATLGGRVFVATLADHAVHAYDAVSGAGLWTFQADSFLGSGPTVAYGTVFIQTGSFDLYALDPATGVPRWTATCGSDDGRGPAVAGTRLFVASGYGSSVEAFDGRTGTGLWAAALDGPDLGSPTALDGKVFVATLTGSLFALDQRSGAVLWQAAIGGAEAPPAVAGGIVYVGDDNGDLYAVRESDGKRLWRTHTQQAFVLSSPIVANGVVYAATQGAYAFDALTGASLWHATSDDVSYAPALVDGVLYVADFSGAIRAFGLPSDGPSAPTGLADITDRWHDQKRTALTSDSVHPTVDQQTPLANAASARRLMSPRLALTASVMLSVLSVLVVLVENKASIQERLHATWPWTGTACQPWSIPWLVAWVAVSGVALGLGVSLTRSRSEDSVSVVASRVAIALACGATLAWVVNWVGGGLTHCVA